MAGRGARYGVMAALLVLVLGAYGFYFKGSSDPRSSLYSYEENEIVLSDDRARHILYGDDRGGGHKYGVGALCKSEFPAEWSDPQILSTIRNIAANDNLTWEKAANGYFVAEDVRGDVVVRVVMGPKRREVITGYPVNLPRNPCPFSPAPANDR